MKKILIFISCTALAKYSYSSDTALVIERAFEAIRNRPVGITERQSHNLYLSPGKKMLIPTNKRYKIEASDFAPLPLMGDWKISRPFLTAVYSNGWHGPDTVYLQSDSKTKAFKIGIAIAYVLWFLGLVIYTISKSRFVLDTAMHHMSKGEHDLAKAALDDYVSRSKARFTHRYEFGSPILLSIASLIILSTNYNANVLVYLSVLFWTFVMMVSLVVIRRIKFSKTQKKILQQLPKAQPVAA